MERDMNSNKNFIYIYKKYIKNFTPKPKYFSNCINAFFFGGCICSGALWLEKIIIDMGIEEKTASAYVVMILIVISQLLTGIGVFDTIGKYAGAGVTVPITGFANAMVSPALEYKKEGVVLGIGAKLFSVAGPVLVCGITISAIVGAIYWLLNNF